MFSSTVCLPLVCSLASPLFLGEPPINEVCGSAVDLPVHSRVFGSTTGGAVDSVPFCGTPVSAAGVWYRAIGNGERLVATTTSAFTQFDTKLSVFSGECNALVCVAGNDDEEFGVLTSRVEWDSMDGAEYWLLVHGFGDDAGEFELIVEEDCDAVASSAVIGGTCTADFVVAPPVMGVGTVGNGQLNSDVANGVGIVFGGDLEFENSPATVFGCDVFIRPNAPVTTFTTDATGDADFDMPIPVEIAFYCGTEWIVQALVTSTNGESEVAISNAVKLRLGSRTG